MLRSRFWSCHGLSSFFGGFFVFEPVFSTGAVNATFPVYLGTTLQLPSGGGSSKGSYVLTTSLVIVRQAFSGMKISLKCV